MKLLVAHNFYKSNLIGGEDVVAHREIQFLKHSLGEANVFQYTVNNDSLKSLSLMKNIWGNPKHAQNIVQQIKQHQVDILHVHNEFPLLTPLVFKQAKLAGCRVVQTLHNFRQHCLSGILYKNNTICHQCVAKSFKWPGIINQCYRGSFLQSAVHAMAQYWYQFKKYHEYIDAYFVLTQFQLDLLKRFGIPEQKLLLKPNFMAEQPSLPTIENRKGFIYVGRIERAKGILALLSLWHTLPTSYELTVIGDGPDFPHAQKYFQKSNIHFKGRCDQQDVISQLQQARYLIHPSLCYETFGLTIIEAMQNGVPVIALNIGPRNEFIQHQKNGFLTDLKHLKSTIKQAAMAVNYPALCQQAQEAAQQFSQQRIGDIQIAHYEKILKH